MDTFLTRTHVNFENMNVKNKIDQINALISQNPWMDMEILNLKSNNLTVSGSIDFTYGHSIEIMFEEVFHMSLNSEWKSDTAQPVLHLVEGEEAIQIYQKHQIEQGNFVFKIIAEGFDTPFYIAAKALNFNTDRVLYFKKEKLEANERIADWVR